MDTASLLPKAKDRGDAYGRPPFPGGTGFRAEAGAAAIGRCFGRYAEGKRAGSRALMFSVFNPLFSIPPVHGEGGWASQTAPGGRKDTVSLLLKNIITFLRTGRRGRFSAIPGPGMPAGAVFRFTREAAAPCRARFRMGSGAGTVRALWYAAGALPTGSGTAGGLYLRAWRTPVAVAV
jgi:hypothetical protein